MTRSILALAFFLAATAAAAQPNGPVPPRVPEIAASGRGEVPITPDRATVLVSVESRASSAATAASENSAKMSSVLSALRRSGLAQSVYHNFHVHGWPGSPLPARRARNASDADTSSGIRGQKHCQ